MSTNTTKRSAGKASESMPGRRIGVIGNRHSARFQVEGLERRVLLASAIAAFQLRQVFSTGSNSYSVTAADVNGDGKMDLIVGNNGSNQVSVLLGNGNGTFQFRRTFGTGAGPSEVSVADVNADGRPDIVVLNTDGTIGVLLGNGNGTFQSQATVAAGMSTGEFVVTDVNGDGKLDIVTGNSTAGTIGVLLSNGNGTFQPQQTVSSGLDHPSALATGDLNGDGKPDLVFSTGYHEVGVLLGNGNGTFQSPQFFPAGTPTVVRAIVVADVNQDGKADIITANQNPSVSVLLGNGNGTLQAPQTYASGGPSTFTDYVAVADVNVDGKPDLIYPDPFGDNVVVRLGNGDGTFGAPQSFLAGLDAGALVVSDVNGDGRPDVACVINAFNEVAVLLGDVPPVVQSIVRSSPPGPNTTGNATFTVAFSEPVTGVDPTDFTVPTTGGVTDTGVSVSGSGAAYTVHLNGVAGLGTLGLNLVDDGTIKDALGNPLQPGGVAAFQPQHTFAAGPAPRAVAVADINGDGKPDIVTADYYYYNGGVIPTTDAEVGALKGNGDGTFALQSVVLLSTFAASTAIAAADVNGDGRLDLLVATNGNVVNVLLGNGNGTLQNPQSFGVGSNPRSLAVADVNGDGRPDLIVANSSDNTVSVLLGNGNGTFQPQGTFAVGTSPLSVAIGDFNRDGKLDIAVANYGSNSVSVLLGNGNGTFASQQTYADAGGPASLAIADVNRDGAADLVTANFKGNSIGVLLGNGNGTFQAMQTFAAGGFPNSIAVADINGDGKLDAVVNNGNGYNSVSVLLGNGNGTFQLPQSFVGGNFATGLAVADLNGDGRPDVVIANYGSFHISTNTVSVLLGNSNANFTGPVYTVIGPTASVTSINRSSPATPITGASTVSFAVTFSTTVTNVSPSDFQVINSGDVSFANPLGVSGSGTSYTVTINGIRGNGTLELALVDHDTIVDSFGTPLGGAGIGNGSFTGQSYSILQTYPTVLSINRSSPVGPNTSASSVTFAVTFNTLVTGVSAGSFQVVTTGTSSFTDPLVLSGSGASYAVTVNGISGSGTLGLNLADNGTIHDALGNPLQAAPAFRPPQPYATGNTPPNTDPNGLSVSDINGDGIPDLVITSSRFNYLTNSVEVLLGNGNGTFQPQQTLSAGTAPGFVVAADLNGDGIPDLAVIAEGGDVSILLGNGNGTFQPRQTFAAGPGLRSLVVADVNGDGKPDLVVLGSAVAVLLGNGNGTFQPQLTFAVGNSPEGLAVADFNGDGKPDVVVANYLGQNVSVLLGNGNGTFQPQVTFATGPAFSVAAADVNGDGIPDLLVANYRNNNVSVLLGNGNGTFKPQQTFAAGASAAVIAASDINGDGELDIVVTNRINSNFGVLLGNGNGTFQAQVTFATGFLPGNLAVADLNGDGRPDIVTPNFYNTTSVMLANSNGNFTGQTYNIILNLDTITGTSGIDQITLMQDGDGQHIDWTLNATTQGQMLINDPNGLTVIGNGSNDIITLVYAGGTNPLPNAVHLNGTFTVNNLIGANPLAGTRLDIGKSTIFISYAGPTSDPILAIQSYIRNGYNGGSWNGTPTPTTGVITSIPAQTNNSYMIGYADSADGIIAGQPGNTVELKYTLGGDLNLAGTVVFSDFALVVANYGKPAVWDTGAITYDSTVSFADFAMTVANYGKQAVTAVATANQTPAAPAPYADPPSSAVPLEVVSAAPARPRWHFRRLAQRPKHQ